MESLAPVLVDEMELLVDLMPDDTHVLVLDPERARSRAHDLVATSEEFLGASWAAAAGGGTAPIDLGARVVPRHRRRPRARPRPGQGLVVGEPVRASTTDAETDVDVIAGAVRQPRDLPAKPADAYRGEMERAIADIAGWRRDGYRVVVRARRPRPGRADARGARRARPRRPGRRGHRRRGRPDRRGRHGHLRRGRATASSTRPTGSPCSPARTCPGQKASTRDMRRMPARRKKQIDPLELSAGDYVVHEQHGVGRFVEMKQREVGGAVREYLVLEYGASKRGGPPDRLYVPADALDQVTRYVGGESPSLDRLGGADWTKRKNRARKAVREIAAELIKLYAARQATKGYAFGPDTPWQRELEDAFPFHETPDQLTTVDEVKGDMMRTVPMDRLVCGDVGYGKTEIAVRAAFKAVQDGKQVAVLVPTTLLVTQHL